jgi:hypothetical protein
MHGVGGETALAVLNAAGFTDVTLVAEQAQPDPDFPTVSFPNPEEPGALDLALETAVRLDADIVIANDPDADRAAVAAKDPDTGAWRMLRGDEVGALLGAHVAARLAAAGGSAGGGDSQGVFANSIVSSRLLARIAAAAGFAHEETLTGFKWISRVPGLLYGYEEALGYCVAPELVRDKDGISAAVLIAELAAAAKADGKTVFDTLDDLYLQHGLHASDQLSIRVADLGLLDAMMNRLRVSSPESFGSSAVEVFTDLAEGTEQLPPTDGLLYLTRDLTRVIIRPSGTEPKLKCYLEVIHHVGSAAELPAARQAARAALDEALRDVKEALGLRTPKPEKGARPGALCSGLELMPGTSLQPDFDEAVHHAGAERCDAQARGAEALAGFEVIDLFVQGEAMVGRVPRDPRIPRAITCAPVAGSSWATAKTSAGPVRKRAIWRPATRAASPQAGSRSSTRQTRCQPVVMPGAASSVAAASAPSSSVAVMSAPLPVRVFLAFGCLCGRVPR